MSGWDKWYWDEYLISRKYCWLVGIEYIAVYPVVFVCINAEMYNTSTIWNSSEVTMSAGFPFPVPWPHCISLPLCILHTFRKRNANHIWIWLSDCKTVTLRPYCLCSLQIAEHVDSTDGFLSKLSLYKALALIALAQQGKQPSPKLLENCILGRGQWQQCSKCFT